MSSGHNIAKGVSGRLRYAWASLTYIVNGSGAAAVLKLAESYKRLFHGIGASEQDAQLVLCDLAVLTKAYNVVQPGPGVTEYGLGFDNGMKYVFEHIVTATGMSPEQLEALRQMSLRELENSKRGG